VQTSPLGLLGWQTVLAEGCAAGQIGDMAQTFPGASQLPDAHDHWSRHSGRTELP
jgi:hypothetical protein